jgi:hypothetical protein
MDFEQLRKQLIAAARNRPPSDSVPYAFEKRIMAHLTRQVLVDPWAVWGRALWRAAAPCVAIMCAMTIWAIFSGDFLSSKNSIATDLESTVFAPLANLEETW